MEYLSLSLIVHPFLEKKLGTQIWLTRNKNPEKETSVHLPSMFEFLNGYWTLVTFK